MNEFFREVRSLRIWCCFFILAGLLSGHEAHAGAESADKRPVFDRARITVSGDSGPEQNLEVEVARTGEQQAYGLMFLNELPGTDGMLFVSKQPRVMYFWMKNTLIPLDIIFIGADSKIVKVVAGATPLSTMPMSSEKPVLMALEIQGGRAARLGIRPGARVALP
ncbi:MAG: DUF192 domain-containing protein [Alphaproteobacteria bacterium]